MSTINMVYQLYRGTSKAWEKKNPVLRSGEPGFEIDTNNLKIGDGVKAWNDLPYVTNSETVVIIEKLLNEEIARSLEKDASHDEALKTLSDAQVDMIKGIQINGTLITAINNIVNIPIGGESLGVVKTSSVENGISIADDGSMSVNNINVNKLVQTEGTFLILDGGSASLNI